MLNRTLRMRPGAVAVVSAILLCIAMPAVAGPPFVTDDPVPPEYRTWEVNYALTGTHAGGATAGSLPGIDANYGAAQDLQLHVQAQMAYVAANGARAFGISDTEIGVKYRVTAATGETDAWAVGVYPIYTIPTGDAHRGLGTGASSIYLPVWLQTTRGRWATFGGGGYSLNGGTGNRNNWSAGWAALYQLREGLQLGGEVFARTADTAGGSSSSGFNLGGVRELTQSTNLLFSAGRGLRNTAATNQASFYLGIQVIY
jgi:hypothetical protein